jgi:hypothetical protein
LRIASEQACSDLEQRLPAVAIEECHHCTQVIRIQIGGHQIDPIVQFRAAIRDERTTPHVSSLDAFQLEDARIDGGVVSEEGLPVGEYDLLVASKRAIESIVLSNLAETETAFSLQIFIETPACSGIEDPFEARTVFVDWEQDCTEMLRARTRSESSKALTYRFVLFQVLRLAVGRAVARIVTVGASLRSGVVASYAEGWR